MADIYSQTWPSSSLNAFTTAQLGTSSVIESSATAARGGSGFGVRSFLNSQASFSEEAWARYQYTYPSSTHVVEAECYVNRITNPTGDGVVTVFAIRQESGLFNYVLSVRWSGSSFDNSWTLVIRNRDGTTPGVTFTMPAGTGFQQWRLVYDRSGTNPIGRFIVDGVEIATITDTSSGTALTPDIIELGQRELQWSASASEIYYDDLTVRDAMTSLIVGPVDYRAAGVQALTITAPEVTVLARVPKVWTFASNSETLVDGATNANITFQYNGTAQAVEFVSTTTGMVLQSESATGTPVAWTSWGVPSDRRVTSVRFDSLSEQTVNATGIAANLLIARVTDNAYATTVLSGDLVATASMGTTTDASAQTYNTTVTRTVNTSFQAANSQVAFVLGQIISTSSVLQTSNTVTGTTSSTAGANSAPALPASGLVANSTVLVAVFYSRTANTSANVSIAAGWTERVRSTANADGLLVVWTRTYQTGDTAPAITVTGHTTGTSGDTALSRVFGINNVDTSNPIANTGSISSWSAATNMGPISGVTLPANGFAMVIGAKRDDFTSVATLSGDGLTWVEWGEHASTTGADAGMVVDYVVNTTANAIALANKTFTVTGGTSVTGKGVMLAFNPRPATANVVQLYDNITISMFAEETDFERAANPQVLWITAPEVTLGSGAIAQNVSAGNNIVTLTAPAQSIAMSTARAAGNTTLTLTASTATYASTLTLAAGDQSLTLTAPAHSLGVQIALAGGAQALTVTAPAQSHTTGAVDVAAGAQALTLTAPDVTVSASVGLAAGAQALTITAPATSQTSTVTASAGAQVLTTDAPVATFALGVLGLAAGAQLVTLTAANTTTAVSGIGRDAGNTTLTFTAPSTTELRTVTLGAGNTTITITAPVANSAIAINAPQFRSDSITTYGARTSTTITAPTGIANNDILLLVVLAATASTDTASLVLPSGFTIIKGYPYYYGASTTNATAGRVRVYAAWKRANAEAGDYVVAHHPTGAGFSTQGYMMAISGAKTTGVPVIDVSRDFRYGDVAGAGNTATAPSVTSSVANTLVAFYSINWGTANTTPPTGTTPTFTERQDTALLYTATGVLSAAQNTGSKVHNLAGNATNTPWAAGMFVITPVEEPSVGAGTVTKVWNFNTDAEGLADAGLNANVTFQYDSANGIQIRSTTSNQTLVSERMRRASTGETWETWGVPAGKQVTHITLNGLNERTVNASAVTANHLKLRVIDSTGNSVHTDDLVSNAWLSVTNTVDGAYANLSLVSSYAVSANRRYSNTDVRLEIEHLLTTNSSAANLDQRLDSISLTIHYQDSNDVSLSAGNTVLTITAPASSQVMSRAASAGAQPVTITAPTSVVLGGNVAQGAGAQVLTLTAPTATIDSGTGIGYAWAPGSWTYWADGAWGALASGVLVTDAQILTISAPTAARATTLSTAAGNTVITLTAPTATHARGISAGNTTLTFTAPTALASIAVGAGAQAVTLTAPAQTQSVSVARAAGAQPLTITAPTAALALTSAVSAGAQALSITAPVASVVVGSVARSAGAQVLTLTASTTTTGIGAVGVAVGQQTVTFTAPTTSLANGSFALAAGNTILTITAATVNVATTLTTAAGNTTLTLTAPTALPARGMSAGAQVLTATAPNTTQTMSVVISAGAQVVTFTAPIALISSGGQLNAAILTFTAPTATVSTTPVVRSAGQQTVTLTASAQSVAVQVSLSAGAQTLTTTAPLTTVTASVAVAAGTQVLTTTAPNAVSVATITVAAGTQALSVTAPTATVVATVARSAGAQVITLTAPTATSGLAGLRDAGVQTLTLSAPSATVGVGARTLAAGLQAITLTAPATTGGSELTRPAGSQTVTTTAPAATTNASVALTTTAQLCTLTAGAVTVRTTVAVSSAPQTVTATAPVQTTAVTRNASAGQSGITISAPVAVLVPIRNVVTDPMELTIVAPIAVPRGGAIAQSTGTVEIAITAPGVDAVFGLPPDVKLAGTQVLTITAPAIRVQSTIADHVAYARWIVPSQKTVWRVPAVAARWIVGKQLNTWFVRTFKRTG